MSMNFRPNGVSRDWLTKPTQRRTAFLCGWGHRIQRHSRREWVSAAFVKTTLPPRYRLDTHRIRLKTIQIQFNHVRRGSSTYIKVQGGNAATNFSGPLPLRHESYARGPYQFKMPPRNVWKQGFECGSFFFLAARLSDSFRRRVLFLARFWVWQKTGLGALPLYSCAPLLILTYHMCVLQFSWCKLLRIKVRSERTLIFYFFRDVYLRF